MGAHPLEGCTSADMLLDDHSCRIPLRLQSSTSCLPLAQLCGFPEAAASEVAAHMSLDDGCPPIGLHIKFRLSSERLAASQRTADSTYHAAHE